VSIVEFKPAKLLQEAKLSGITIKDIARALATIAGVKAVADFDAGLTGGYLDKAEALLELATEFAQERRRNAGRGLMLVPLRHDRFTPRSSPSCQYFAWVRANSKEERYEKEG